MIFDCLGRIRTIHTMMWYMQKDMMSKCDLPNEWSAESWSADDSCGEGCAQLDNCTWILEVDDRVGDRPAPDLQADLSDSESDIYDDAPDTTCPPVVAQTRPKEGCDPASPRRLCRGRDVLMEDSMVPVDTGRVSIARDPDVSGIHVMMPDCVPAVMPILAATPQVASEVAQSRPRGDCNMNLLLPVDGSKEPLDDDAPEVLSSGREPAAASSEVGRDVCVVPDLLQTAVSVTTVVSEKWMEMFVLNLDDIRSDVLASGEDPAGGSSDVGSDVCVVPDPLPTVVSVRTVVAEEWMDWFVLDLVECPSVSRTSAVARTFRPAVSEEYSPAVLAGGGEVADEYPLVVVESDTTRVSDLPMVESDTARVSVLPVAGCKFPAVFLGKVALDVVGLGIGLPCLRVD